MTTEPTDAPYHPSVPSHRGTAVASSAPSLGARLDRPGRLWRRIHGIAFCRAIGLARGIGGGRHAPDPADLRVLAPGDCVYTAGFRQSWGYSPVGSHISADDLEAEAASATPTRLASLAPSRHCPACGAELPYLGGRGRPRRWCDVHHPRPLRLRPRAAPERQSGALTPALASSSAERKKGPAWRAEPQCRLAAARPGLLGGLNRSAGRSSSGTRPR